MQKNKKKWFLVHDKVKENICKKMDTIQTKTKKIINISKLKTLGLTKNTIHNKMRMDSFTNILLVSISRIAMK